MRMLGFCYKKKKDWKTIIKYKETFSELFKYKVYFEYYFDIRFMCHTSLWTVCKVFI